MAAIQTIDLNWISTELVENFAYWFNDDKVLTSIIWKINTNGVKIFDDGGVTYLETNEGIETIGVKDGNIDENSPFIKGKVEGIRSTGTINFYDGTIKGKVDSINGTVSDIEENSTRVDLNEVINGETYHITYLQ